jgi:hypothetical protein
MFKRHIRFAGHSLRTRIKLQLQLIPMNPFEARYVCLQNGVVFFEL